MSSRQQVVYILGPSFSGSTLLTFLLAQHPDICTMGELKAPYIDSGKGATCSCGELIVECEFWKELEQRLHRMDNTFSLSRFGTRLESDGPVGSRVINTGYRGAGSEFLRGIALSLFPSLKRALEDKLNHNRQVIECICEIQRGSIFLDGSKTAIRLYHFLKSGIWDISVINLRRDPRGVVLSNVKNMGISFEESVSRWVRATREIERVAGLVDTPRIMNLQYEDLCKHPAEMLSRLSAFIGLSEFDFSDQIAAEGDFHILGNNMRLSGVSEIRLDEKWRSKITKSQEHYLARKAGPLIESIGYNVGG